MTSDRAFGLDISCNPLIIGGIGPSGCLLSFSLMLLAATGTVLGNGAAETTNLVVTDAAAAREDGVPLILERKTDDSTGNGFSNNGGKKDSKGSDPDSDSEKPAGKSTKAESSKQTERPYKPHVDTQVDRLHAKGITGEKTKIDILGFGLDYTHPALGNGTFGLGKPIVDGVNVNGDADVKLPANNCPWEVTYAAGVIAAQPGVLAGFGGVAPSAKLASYTFKCRSNMGDRSKLQPKEDWITLLDKAEQDGAHIIITPAIRGGNKGNEGVRQRISQLVKKGTPVFMSPEIIDLEQSWNPGYNNYPAGALIVANGLADEVSSRQEIHQGEWRKTATDTEGESFPYVPSYPHEKLPIESRKLIKLKFGDEEQNCKYLSKDTPDLRDAVALVPFLPACGYEKLLNFVAEKGGKHVLLYTELDEKERPLRPIHLPADSPILSVGLTSQNWVAQSSHRAKFISVKEMKYEPISIPIEKGGGGTVHSSSPWGPSLDMEMSPQFTAPGASILSTQAFHRGYSSGKDIDRLSGAYAAGVAALVKSVRGKHLDPAAIEALLSTTAKPLRFFNPKKDEIPAEKNLEGLAPVLQQGAGLIQAFDAAYTKTIIMPASLTFKPSEKNRALPPLNFTLENQNDKPVIYKLSKKSALTVDMRVLFEHDFFEAILPNEAAIWSNQEWYKFEVGPRQTVTITLEARQPDNLDEKIVAVWSGFLQIHGSDGSLHSIPYQGLHGSLSDLLRIKNARRPKSNPILEKP